MYRVSPQLLVTKEHIISESSSTSPSAFSGGVELLRFSVLLVGSGDAIALRGVDSPPSLSVL